MMHFHYLKDFILLGMIHSNIANSISSSRKQVCVIEKHSQTVSCYGGIAGENNAPPNSNTTAFDSISCGDTFCCGIIRSGRQLKCWKGGSFIKTGLVDETGFRKISTGRNHACGLKNRQIVCIGRDDFDQGNSPSGYFVDVSCGNKDTCGIDINGQIHCFGIHYHNSKYNIIPPNGNNFMQISVGPDTQACAVSSQGDIYCWGSGHTDNDVKKGDFVHVAVHSQGYCGIQLNLTVNCWGRVMNPFDSFPTNMTQLREISMGSNHVCGVNNSTSILYCNHALGPSFGASFPTDVEVYV